MCVYMNTQLRTILVFLKCSLLTLHLEMWQSYACPWNHSSEWVSLENVVYSPNSIRSAWPCVIFSVRNYLTSTPVRELFLQVNSTVISPPCPERLFIKYSKNMCRINEWSESKIFSDITLSWESHLDKDCVSWHRMWHWKWQRSNLAHNIELSSNYNLKDTNSDINLQDKTVFT
jgi:hypothetical protein